MNGLFILFYWLYYKKSNNRIVGDLIVMLLIIFNLCFYVLFLFLKMCISYHSVLLKHELLDIFEMLGHNGCSL